MWPILAFKSFLFNVEKGLFDPGISTGLRSTVDSRAKGAQNHRCTWSFTVPWHRPLKSSECLFTPWWLHTLLRSVLYRRTPSFSAFRCFHLWPRFDPYSAECTLWKSETQCTHLQFCTFCCRTKDKCSVDSSGVKQSFAPPISVDQQNLSSTNYEYINSRLVLLETNREKNPRNSSHTVFLTFCSKRFKCLLGVGKAKEKFSLALKSNTRWAACRMSFR